MCVLTTASWCTSSAPPPPPRVNPKQQPCHLTLPARTPLQCSAPPGSGAASMSKETRSLTRGRPSIHRLGLDRHDVRLGPGGPRAVARKSPIGPVPTCQAGNIRAISDLSESEGDPRSRRDLVQDLCWLEGQYRWPSRSWLIYGSVYTAVDEDLSCCEAAAQFKISVSSAIRWQAHLHQTGSLVSGRPGGDRRSGRIEM